MFPIKSVELLKLSSPTILGDLASKGKSAGDLVQW